MTAVMLPNSLLTPVPHHDDFDRTPSLTNSDETSVSDSDYFVNVEQSSLPAHISFSNYNSKPSLDRPLPLTPRQQEKQRSKSLTKPSHLRTTALISTVCQPYILTCLLDYLPWGDFHALVTISRKMQHQLWRPDLKDLILSRFVLGYTKALRTRDPRFWTDNIQFTFRELEIYMSSLAVPLHQYPMHGLSVLSSEVFSRSQQEMTSRMQIYSRMHSRLVLLLQSMVHSSRAPIFYDLDDPQSRNINISHSSIRELKFPAPLSYFGEDANGEVETKSIKSINEIKLDRGRTGSVNDSKLHQRHRSEDISRPGLSPKRQTGSRLSNLVKKGYRVPIPPPLEEPPSLREFSSTWKQRTYSASVAVSDDDNILQPPSRRFASANASSSSSISSTPTQSSLRPAPSSPILSPHDLRMATSRTRAPIIRLFLPCSTFSDDVISACEEQLLSQGLWQHLSVGDIICNLGYVPPVEEASDNAVAGSGSDTNSLDAMPSDNSKRWLLFTGERLAPFDPATAPPISDPLSLPSPFYYITILSADVNPRFIMSLPPLQPNFTLSIQSELVSSPKSQLGRVRVKQYVWLGSVEVRFHPTMGYGWSGEWILQGEGTKEGRQSLVDAVQGGEQSQREWEVVREKCSNGKLWLKLLTVPASAEGLSSQGHGIRLAA